MIEICYSNWYLWSYFSFRALVPLEVQRNHLNPLWAHVMISRVVILRSSWADRCDLICRLEDDHQGYLKVLRILVYIWCPFLVLAIISINNFIQISAWGYYPSNQIQNNPLYFVYWILFLEHNIQSIHPSNYELSYYRMATEKHIIHYIKWSYSKFFTLIEPLNLL